MVGTLIGRRIEGPTDSATHLYVILLAPTGYGKDHPLQCGSALMHASGRGDLLGTRLRGMGECADSDDLARVYRFDLAQDSEMISPTIPI